MHSKTTEVFSEVFRNLHNMKQQVKEKIADLESAVDGYYYHRMVGHRNTIVYFPSTFTTLQDAGHSVQIVNAIIPESYTKERAEVLCNSYHNGFGETPVAVSDLEFFPLYLNWIDEQFKNTLQLLKMQQ